jgi:hypothetical protein
METGEPVEVYAASCRGRRVSPIVVVLCVCVLLAVLLSRTGLSSRLLQAIQLARTPPTSPIRYSREDAKRLVKAALLSNDPTITNVKVSVSGPLAEYPRVARGCPVYVCTVVAHARRYGATIFVTPIVVLDATTGGVVYSL